MQINQLFKALENASVDCKQIFCDSGMINIFDVLDYGFFPLGSGIFSENSKSQQSGIEHNGIMILGNDFGTKSYVDNECKNRKENNSPTIRNLLSKLQLNTNHTFFTNFYLGVRDDYSHAGTTNVRRIVSLKQDYKTFCFNYFIAQLHFIKPKIVICLGHAVRLAIAENFKQIIPWQPKTISLKKLYMNNNYHCDIEIEEIGNIKLIVIPHPCDLRNFSIGYINEVLKILNVT